MPTTSPTRTSPLEELESEPSLWLSGCMPESFGAQMSRYHRAFYRAVWECTPDHTPDPVLLVMFRGAGKSTSAESAVVALGAMARRRYGLYVSGTQELADAHLASIAEEVATNRWLRRWYPAFRPIKERVPGSRTRTRVAFPNGFTVDAIGLDSKHRGLKLGKQRPDLIVIDDVDEAGDSPTVSAHRFARLTRSLLGTADAGGAFIIGVQNLIQRRSVFHRLVTDTEEPALARRRVIGPVPMIENAQWGKTQDGLDAIIGGDPTWPAMFGLAEAQRQVEILTPGVFRAECQHDLDGDVKGAIWHRNMIRHDPTATRWNFGRITIAIDPSKKGTPGADETGIIAAGVAHHGTGMDPRRWAILADRSDRYTAASWAPAAVDLAIELRADRILMEDNILGDAGLVAIRSAAAARGWRGEVIGRSATLAKDARAVIVAERYGQVSHSQPYPELEDEQCTWVPGESKWSPNRLDAAVWALGDLGANQQAPDELSDLPRRVHRPSRR